MSACITHLNSANDCCCSPSECLYQLQDTFSVLGFGKDQVWDCHAHVYTKMEYMWASLLFSLSKYWTATACDENIVQNRLTVWKNDRMVVVFPYLHLAVLHLPNYTCITFDCHSALRFRRNSNFESKWGDVEAPASVVRIGSIPVYTVIIPSGPSVIMPSTRCLLVALRLPTLLHIGLVNSASLSAPL